MQSLTRVKETRVVTCGHDRRLEVGHHFDEDGRFLKLLRCQRCGLIMREYLPTL